jgi:parallel beta-helix repeat protein
MRRSAFALGVALAIALLGSPTALGHPGHGKKLIEVRPGPGAIAKALDRAEPGGKLRIHSGRYREVIEVTAPVTIVGARKGRRPVIDAQCNALFTVSVRSPGVVLRGLKVVGATDLGGAGTEVDIRGVTSGTVEDLVVRDTCDAEYGVNVFQTGAVSVLDTRATGFSDAGIYVGDITDTAGATLLVGGNEAFGNNKGAIVEFSTGASIRVEGNDLHDNAEPGTGVPTGLYVHDSAGVDIVRNQVRNNGGIGIHLTSLANANVLTDNEITGNPTDILDEGAGNCGSGNVFGSGGPVPPC